MNGDVVPLSPITKSNYYPSTYNHVRKRQTLPPHSRVTSARNCQPKRRDVLITPFLAAGAYAFRSAVAKADEKPALEGEARTPELPQQVAVSSTAEVEADPAVKEEVINSRIYDATVIGEPMALGKDKKKVWEKMMDAEIVYLGEAEQVPIRDDKELELEIVKILRRRHLKIFCNTLAAERWQEYEPLLTYCQENGIRLVACGVPLEVLRTVQAGGVSGLSKVDRTKYAPPAGSGFISGFPSSISRRSSIDINFPNQSALYGPRSYLSVQARAVEDYTMSQVILQAVKGGESIGMLVVVTGASHVTYGVKRNWAIRRGFKGKFKKRNNQTATCVP
ncbi:UNVERIFIED_CONTAM: protein RETICULATA-RELATED 6, chloroplastic [Sesamum calycinum]|uniref:Protein RETICULATA-RELATED 6, chloroplastic n=1 Tax=Sesamum calycinum TaxID=2727403 RepID=A0AAW2KPN2_9LAMI